MIQRFP